MLDTKIIQASSIFIKIISFCFSCKICKNPDRLLVSSAVNIQTAITLAAATAVVVMKNIKQHKQQITKDTDIYYYTVY